MKMVEIKGTWELPSKKKLWLAEVIGVNNKKFSGKRGELLRKYTDSSCQNYDDTYWRVKDYVCKNKFIIASVDEYPSEKANIIYKKIKEFELTEDDIYFMFRFFGNEYGSENLEGVKKKLVDDLELCRKKIKEAQKAELNFQKLIKEMEKL